MLDLVPNGNGQIDVGPNRLVRVWPPLTSAPGKIPTLWFTINLLKSAVRLPIADIGSGLLELGLKQVEPGSVHVHEEAFEPAVMEGPVVMPDRLESLAF